MIDAKAFGLELAEMVKAQLGPVIGRLATLEQRFNQLPAPVDLSADLAAVKAAVEAIEIPEIPQLPELPDIASLVGEAVSSAVAALPPLQIPMKPPLCSEMIAPSDSGMISPPF
jgi:hypothetical protein